MSVRLSIVILVYNEWKFIETIVRRVLATQIDGEEDHMERRRMRTLGNCRMSTQSVVLSWCR